MIKDNPQKIVKVPLYPGGRYGAPIAAVITLSLYVCAGFAVLGLVVRFFSE